jgi:hypothetical protein
MENSKKIYELGLFEAVTIRNLYVRRVPGGWIMSETGDGIEATVFVPFNNEYQL